MPQGIHSILVENIDSNWNFVEGKCMNQMNNVEWFELQFNEMTFYCR